MTGVEYSQAGARLTLRVSPASWEKRAESWRRRTLSQSAHAFFTADVYKIRRVRAPTRLEAAAVVPEERIETLSEETIEHASEPRRSYRWRSRDFTCGVRECVVDWCLNAIVCVFLESLQRRALEYVGNFPKSDSVT